MLPTSNGYVYLIEAIVGNDKIYKIGRSEKPQSRLKDLQISCPAKLTLICQLRTCLMQKLEQELHKKYAHRRIHGEWFRLIECEVNEIRQHPLSDKLDKQKQEDEKWISELQEAISKL